MKTRAKTKMMAARAAATAVGRLGRRQGRTALASFASLTIAASLHSAARAADPTVLLPSAIVDPAGELVTGRAILVEGGRITAVVDAGSSAVTSARDGSVIRFAPGSVVSPGLIDLVSELGIYRQNLESAAAIDARLDVLDAFDPEAPETRGVLEAGITAVQLAPRAQSLVSGRCATIRTGVPLPAPRERFVLNAPGAFLVALGSSTWQGSRLPTSRPGALHLLRTALDAAARDADDPMHALVARQSPTLLWCERVEDVISGREALSAHGIAPILVLSDQAADAAPLLAGARGSSVIVGPYDFRTPPRELRGAARLEAQGLEIGFRAGLPLAEGARLRVTACLSVRNGLSATAARRGLTSTAARIAGVADRIGSLQPDRLADLVVFSDDPLRLDARVEEVWVDGRAVIRRIGSRDAEASTDGTR